MPQFYADPIAGYNSIAATVPSGQRYAQGFDFEGAVVEYAEKIYPNGKLFDPVNGANAWDFAQQELSDCVYLAELGGISESQNVYTIEKDLIYPTVVSPIGLYMISVADGLQRKWMPIDSRVPVFPATEPRVFLRGFPRFACPNQVESNGESWLWGMIFEKAAAVLRGNYTAINQYNIGKPFPGWLPTMKRYVSDFAGVLDCVQRGGYAGITMRQQTNAAGLPIEIPGITLNHQYEVVNAARIVDKSGFTHEILRIHNPWSAGSVDYKSPLYDEDSPFWIDNKSPSNDKLYSQAKGHAGDFWVGFTELANLRGTSSYSFKIPLPITKYPYQRCINFTIDATTATKATDRWNGRYPEQGQLKPIAIAKKDLIVIDCAEPTEFLVQTKFLPGAIGALHSYIVLAANSSDVSLINWNNGCGYWGSEGCFRFTLSAGRLNFYPAAVEQPTDRGTMEILILADKPTAKITRNGILLT